MKKKTLEACIRIIAEQFKRSDIGDVREAGVYIEHLLNEDSSNKMPPINWLYGMNYLAMNSNESWFFYELEPYLGTDTWLPVDGGYVSCNEINHIASNWKKSLIRRPQ